MKKILIVGMCMLALVACTQDIACEQLEYNNRNALNVVFLQDGFSKEEIGNLSNYVMETILEKEPFKSNSHMNFYLIKNNDTRICKPGPLLKTIGGYSRNPLPPLACNITKITELVTQCNIEKGKIIILTNDTVVSQTSLSYDESAVMFLDMKNQPPEVIQHEFAHFFGLVDEKAKLYSHALGPGREPAPNCVTMQTIAKLEWGNLYPENHMYAKGCAGNREWYTPEGQTLLSRHPDPEWGYGAFNEWYMGKVMDCCYSRDRERQSCDTFFESYPEWASCRS